MNDAINPDFKTSIHSDDPIMDAEQIIELIENSRLVLRFRMGYVTSREFTFITKANFDIERRSEVVEKKSPEERMKTQENIDVVQKYLCEAIGKDINLKFISRHDSECALYDENRFSFDRINEKMKDYFGH